MAIHVNTTCNDSNISKAVELHIKYLSYRSFITKFGHRFLLELYKDWLAADNAVFIYSLEKNSMNGFVLGIKNKHLLFAPLKKHPLKYSMYILKGIFKNPSLIRKLVETIFYKNKSNTTTKAELLVIVTDETERSKGLGSELVNHLNQEFAKFNINEYVVTVHAEMARSNNFYIKNRMQLEKSFDLYNTKWNMYKKNTLHGK